MTSRTVCGNRVGSEPRDASHAIEQPPDAVRWHRHSGTHRAAQTRPDRRCRQHDRHIHFARRSRAESNRQLTVRDRAAHRSLFARPSRSDYEIAHSAIERLGITHLAGRPYTRISGGERQLADRQNAGAAGTNHSTRRTDRRRPNSGVPSEVTRDTCFHNKRLLHWIEKATLVGVRAIRVCLSSRTGC